MGRAGTFLCESNRAVPTRQQIGCGLLYTFDTAVLQAVFSIIWPRTAQGKSLFGRGIRRICAVAAASTAAEMARIGPRRASRNPYDRAASGLAAQRFGAVPLPSLAEEEQAPRRDISRHLPPPRRRRQALWRCSGRACAGSRGPARRAAPGATWKSRLCASCRGKAMSELGLPRAYLTVSCTTSSECRRGWSPSMSDRASREPTP